MVSPSETDRQQAPTKRRKRLSPGWVPDQHGAWAMISIPALSGAVLAGFDWIHLPLLLFWWLGYFFFQAAMLWLKSRRKPRYFPPVRAYAIAMLPFGLAVAIMRFELAIWVPAFLPMVAVAVWASSNRKERTYANDSATVFAAVLMVAVTFHAGATLQDPRWPWVWLVFAVEFAYFWGTIPHVKALIRERNRPEAAKFSFAAHTGIAVAVIAAVAVGWFADALLGGWFLAALWVALAVRAYLMPWWQRNRRQLTPLQIGMTEVVFSLLIATALLI